MADLSVYQVSSTPPFAPIFSNFYARRFLLRSKSPQLLATGSENGASSEFVWLVACSAWGGQVCTCMAPWSPLCPNNNLASRSALLSIDCSH
uniref:Uncharacterized protein n=1 Tax=Arundo donax TaxID=35708 RepID=A0A0A9DWT2_ARUDO